MGRVLLLNPERSMIHYEKKYLVGALLILGSGFIIYSSQLRADDQKALMSPIEETTVFSSPIQEQLVSQDNNVPPVIPDVTPSSTQEGPLVQFIDVKDVTEDIQIPLEVSDITTSVDDNIKSSRIYENNVEKVVSVDALRTPTGEEIRATYQLQDGKSKVSIIQSRNPYELNESLETIKSWYDPQFIKKTEIQGHPVIIEDGPQRKHVHLVTETHLYTVNTTDAVDVNYLLSLATSIHAE